MSPARGADAAAVQVLVENHRRFLAFLQRRVGSREAAEDILQEAFVRGMDRARSLRDGESAVAWFYRLLRNAVVDHYRRRDAEARALARYSVEPRDEVVPEAELEAAACECVGAILHGLKAEYAEALRRVDLGGEPVSAFAGAAGISANAASVRLHRARQALRRQVERSCGTCATHGCVDCGCGGVSRGAVPTSGDGCSRPGRP